MQDNYKERIEYLEQYIKDAKANGEECASEEKALEAVQYEEKLRKLKRREIELENEQLICLELSLEDMVIMQQNHI